ncbi:hypothetical protein DRO49_02600 [Candidatus Bathyarchaeota archaeon]|nr:MAG: hypothetical protein DRO49_02600 [Candidatus Bathyarchaeota archaeon]
MLSRKKSYREYINEAKNKIRELFEKEKAMYVTEIKVRLDGSVDERTRFWHWVTYDALQEMRRDGELKRRPRRGVYYIEEEEGERSRKRGSKITFYYPSSLSYADVAPIIRKKLDLVNEYATIASKVGGYAEEVVKKALEAENFTVVGRNVKKFRDREWHRKGEPDFVAYGEKEDRYYAIQVKNRLTYPEWDDIATLIDVSDYFGIRPWFIARQLPGDYTLDIIKSKGFYTTFLKLIIPESHMDLAKKLRDILGFPVVFREHEAIRMLREKFARIHGYP